MAKVIIYTRVSSLGQSTEDKVSLEEQAQSCRQYAEQRGYEVVYVVREVKSASSVRGRPLLLDAMRRIKEGEAEVLLAYCLDRLTRQQSGIYTIDETIRPQGRIEFATEEFEDTPIGRFTRSAKAFVAEAELEKIAIRTAMGRAGRVAKGQLLASHTPLFGYQFEGERKQRYCIDPDTAPTIRRIFADFVAGKPLSRIEQDLNAEGVPTATGKGKWHKPTLRNILIHPAYAGEARALRWRAYRDENYRWVKEARPIEETVLLPEGTIPAIVDRLTFERAQARLERNKAELVRPVDRTDALLSAGFIYCGECGKRMIISRRRSGVALYKCQQGVRGRGDCRPHTISAGSLDSEVWSRIEVILSEPGRLRRLLAIPGRDLDAEVAALDSRIAELEQEIPRLTALVRRLAADDDAAEALLAEIRDSVQRRRTLEESRERLLTEAEDEAGRLARVEATVAAVTQLSGSLATLDHAGKRQALSDLSVKVAVYPSRHESPYRWVMSAFELQDGKRRLWVDGPLRGVECGGSYTTTAPSLMPPRWCSSSRRRPI